MAPAILTVSPSVQTLLGSSELYTCSVIIKGYSADLIDIKYTSLPANQPKENQNFVAVWNASMIPWNSTPMRQEKVPQNSEEGTMSIDGLLITKTSYVVGYSVGPDVGNICCSAVISAGGLSLPPSFIAISLENLGTTSVAIHYQTLAGYRPLLYGNWVGIWKGYVLPYNAPSPLRSAPISTDSSEGSVALNNVPIAVDSVYTVIYFTGKSYTTAAAILTFSTQSAA